MLLLFVLIIFVLVLFLQIARSVKWSGLFGIHRSGFTPLEMKFLTGFTRIATWINADSFKYIFIISIVIIFGLLFERSYQQYQVWSQDELSKFLLPPYQSANYFIFYAFWRFFAPYLISLIAAFLFFFTAKALNKKYGERFFEPEEPIIGALALFLVGHPGWLFYAVFLILIYLVIHIFYISIYQRTHQRLSAYYLWIPVAIFVILINNWLQGLPLWGLLKL